MPHIDPQQMADRYVALWNDPDEQARRKTIAELWAEDGVHLLHPPEEIREVAATLGFPAPTLEAHGHQAIETRVSRAHDDFVAGQGFSFRPQQNAVLLGSKLKLVWETMPPEGDTPLGTGLVILTLNEDGRIKTDHQFPS